MDREKREIAVQRSLPTAVKRFTAAHEIGHWILHKERQQFRDSPLDGSHRKSRKPFNEWEAEADYFAAVLLMPEKIVRKEFRRHFGTKTLASMPVDERLTWVLSFGARKEVRLSNLKTNQDISRLAAQCCSLNDIGAGSLAERFGVSVDAMAIRLEELDLVPVLPTQEVTAYDVFISYNRKDVKEAQYLYIELKRRGFNPWYDALLPLGRTWDKEIESALEASGTAVVLIGTEGLRGFQVTEVMSLIDSDKPIMPVFISGWNGSVPFLLKRFQGVDLRKRPGDALQKLARGIIDGNRGKNRINR